MGSFFLGKVTALGVLCCFALFVCLTLLASFFLPSHLSFKNMYIHTCCIYILYILIANKASQLMGKVFQNTSSTDSKYISCNIIVLKQNYIMLYIIL